MVEKAEAFAKKAHEGQVDKSGKPYFGHPKAVAAMVEGEVEKTVAYLHDVVEDTGVSVEEIRSLFGDEVADAVDLLTHREGVPYFDYVEKIKANPVARRVKMADLTHNMDLSRLDTVTEKDLKRIEKYKKAYAMLA